MSDTPKLNEAADGGSSLPPFSVSLARREVIENKLLVALEEEGVVAILANEEMLDDLIRACWNYEGDIKRRARIESIRADLTQLRDGAFPPNSNAPKDNDKTQESTALLAVAPFTPDAYGGMKDADGDRVITCDDECPPCTLYKERMVDADDWFMCPKCGRLGQRMEEASHRQVLTANVPGVAVASPTSTDPTP